MGFQKTEGEEKGAVFDLAERLDSANRPGYRRTGGRFSDFCQTLTGITADTKPTTGGFVAIGETVKMGNMRMRVFYGPSADAPAAPADERVTVPLGDICELLAEAHTSGRAWISDFSDDEVTISADLYDVLMAYRFYRKRRD